MTATIEVLAACTLLYTAAGEDTAASMAYRLTAYEAANRVEALVPPDRMDKFHEDVELLLDALTANPAVVEPLALQIGPQCKTLAGIDD